MSSIIFEKQGLMKKENTSIRTNKRRVSCLIINTNKTNTHWSRKLT